MEILELMKSRHSVRRYLAKAIETGKRAELDALAMDCSAKSGLRFEIIYDEPKCFGALFSRAASFRNCTNYIAVIGPKADDSAEEKAGYYGEQLVLKAQELGLNTCWVALTHGKAQAVLADSEKVIILIAVGYGETQGNPHRNKPKAALADLPEDAPEWYRKGVEGAMLAPTAVNQQKFHIAPDEDCAVITAGKGSFVNMDLGIVKYHFEAASGHKVR